MPSDYRWLVDASLAASGNPNTFEILSGIRTRADMEAAQMLLTHHSLATDLEKTHPLLNNYCCSTDEVSAITFSPFR